MLSNGVSSVADSVFHCDLSATSTSPCAMQLGADVLGAGVGSQQEGRREVTEIFLLPALRLLRRQRGIQIGGGRAHRRHVLDDADHLKALPVGVDVAAQAD